MPIQKALQDTAIIIEDTGSLYANEQAKILAERLGLHVHTMPANAKKQSFSTAQWQLVFTAKGLVLRVASEPSWSDIIVDFNAESLSYRKHHGGGRNEAIAKAIGIKGKDSLSVLDCTAGMGTDSFVMASVGANVCMLERNPLIAALLEDALYRNQQDLNLQLLHHDAISYLQNEHSKTFDVVYLDPMFPHKKKSALVKKEMRAFQLLLGADSDSKDLLTAAIKSKPTRIVVKRPSVADPLQNQQDIAPTMAINSKKHRFDVYLL